MTLACFRQHGTTLDAIDELTSHVRKGIKVSLTSFSSHVGKAGFTLCNGVASNEAMLTSLRKVKVE